MVSYEPEWMCIGAMRFGPAIIIIPLPCLPLVFVTKDGLDEMLARVKAKQPGGETGEGK
jgi:hypothetical protein